VRIRKQATVATASRTHRPRARAPPAPERARSAGKRGHTSSAPRRRRAPQRGRTRRGYQQIRSAAGRRGRARGWRWGRRGCCLGRGGDGGRERARMRRRGAGGRRVATGEVDEGGGAASMRAAGAAAAERAQALPTASRGSSPVKPADRRRLGRRLLREHALKVKAERAGPEVEGHALVAGVEADGGEERPRAAHVGERRLELVAVLAAGAGWGGGWRVWTGRGRPWGAAAALQGEPETPLLPRSRADSLSRTRPPAGLPPLT
jgi:hypothetical protein